MSNPICIVVHGGAGTVAEDLRENKIRGVKNAVRSAYKVLLSDAGTALDAVEAAVRHLENDEHFNAGFGSVLNLDGDVEMGASIMDGKNLNAGAVAIVQDIANPICLARMVMEKTPHVLLGAEGAKRFAKENGVPILSPGALVTQAAKHSLEKFKAKFNPKMDAGELSTVGAVAVDREGNVAAATSTGGLMGKMVGRISDTPLIGCGTYATNELGAVSTTGYGEAITKTCLAYAIVQQLEKTDLNARQATETAISNAFEKLRKGTGAITVTRNGDFGVYFSTPHMSWAAIHNTKLLYGIEADRECSEDL